MVTVGLSTETYDLEGDIILTLDLGSSDLKTMSRRISRVATLDGGVSVSDFGYSEGDRTFTIAVTNVTEYIEYVLTRIFTLYSGVVLSTVGGVYSAVCKDYSVNKTTGTILLVMYAKG